MADLTRDDILKLARLSKLDLSDEQVVRFRDELQAIVGYVEQLQSIDVTGLKPTNQVTGLTNVTRPDEIIEYANQAELLKNLPDQENGQIKVKRMLA
ncbi:MAG: Asp-tRNA(Asn)/Glu-tRNA(Gln) amidotransferase subunit GatC [Candidatus Saccharimonadales bacterium]